MQLAPIKLDALTHWMIHPFQYPPDEHDDGPNWQAHNAKKEALMKQASGYEGEFGKGAWAFDVEVLKMQPRGFKTPADRDAVVDAIENLGGHVYVWAVHYLACTDNNTWLLAFVLIKGKGLHMGIMIPRAPGNVQ
jgi:hypothetical protein